MCDLSSKVSRRHGATKIWSVHPISKPLNYASSFIKEKEKKIGTEENSLLANEPTNRREIDCALSCRISSIIDRRRRHDSVSHATNFFLPLREIYHEI